MSQEERFGLMLALAALWPLVVVVNVAMASLVVAFARSSRLRASPTVASPSVGVVTILVSACLLRFAFPAYLMQDLASGGLQQWVPWPFLSLLQAAPLLVTWPYLLVCFVVPQLVALAVEHFSEMRSPVRALVAAAAVPTFTTAAWILAMWLGVFGAGVL